MTPQKQEFTSKPEIRQFGDCQRAVIASLLDLPIAEVPHFLQEANGCPSKFWEGLQEFCNKHGYLYLTCKNAGTAFGFDGDIYHEIAGPSPRGNGLVHAVVGKNGQVEFDPHPDGTGLAGSPEQWDFAYLVKL